MASRHTRPPSVTLPEPLARAAADWPPERRREFLRFLRLRLATGWHERARAEQLPPEGDWTTLFLRGGRGSGKSWAGSRILAELIAADPLRDSEGVGEWAAVAPTYGDARDTCVESPECGLLSALGTSAAEVAAGESGLVTAWNRSTGELRLKDGSTIFCDGADDGALRIQGRNLRGVWCEEIGLWRRWETAFDESIAFALRKGQARLIATGTPKAAMPARALVRRLIEDPAVVNRRLRTMDNAQNLSATFLEAAKRRAGSRLARQELEGELLEEAEGALWRREWIEDHRAAVAPQSGHAVVALDPAGGQGASAQGLVLASVGRLDGRAYVLRSEALRLSPLQFLVHATRIASEHSASLVIEANYGDQALIGLLEQGFETAGRRVPYRVVKASSAKVARAEAGAALYERALISHIGAHQALEDQMLTFTGLPGEPSDLVDALGWALAELERYGLGRPAVEHEGGGEAIGWGSVGAVEGAAVPWESAVTWTPGRFPPGP